MNIEEQIEATQEQVLDSVICRGRALTVVDSPPGAGKTTMAELVVALAVRTAGMRVCVATPNAKQGFDFAGRLVADYALPIVQILIRKDRERPADLIEQVTFVDDVRALARGPSVVITTAHKLGASLDSIRPADFDLLVIDEAYQLAMKEFGPIADIACRVLLIGDPGQLPPVVQSDTSRLEAAPHRMHWAAPKELLRRFPSTAKFALPASRRLPPDTVRLIQPSFYPSLPFTSVAAAGERRISFAASGLGYPIDRALDLAASGRSIVALLLPRRDFNLGETDEEVSDVMARLVSRSLERGICWPGQGPLRVSDFGCIDAHVASGGAVRRHLRTLSLDDCIADTPEVWQGAERRVMIVKHPLSGNGRPSSFDLEPGRWCVMLSRHQLGCIIVGRDGVREALGGYQHNCGDTPAGAEDLTWLGYRAHAHLWNHLESEGSIVRYVESSPVP